MTSNKNVKLNQIWSTYCSRFNANQRLLNAIKYEIWIPPLLSTFVLSLNISLLFPTLLQTTNKQILITLYTIVLSLIILILSLIWNNQDTKTKAKLFHDCAIEMKLLYDLLESINPEKKYSEYIRLLKKYNYIEKKYSLNHDYLDFKKVKIQQMEGIEKIFNNICFYISVYLKFHFIMHLIIIVPIFFAYYIIRTQ